MVQQQEVDEAGLRLAHQKVSFEIDFELQELVGYTSLTFEDNQVFPETLVLDCSDQCLIKEISVNDIPVTHVLRLDPLPCSSLFSLTTFLFFPFSSFSFSFFPFPFCLFSFSFSFLLSLLVFVQ